MDRDKINGNWSYKFMQPSPVWNPAACNYPYCHKSEVLGKIYGRLNFTRAPLDVYPHIDNCVISGLDSLQYELHVAVHLNYNACTQKS